MTKPPSRDPATYRIGYRKPPSETRFRPGHSGNPRGRPRGIRPIGAVLQDVLGQKVAVTENGKTRKIPAFEVMLRRLANDAMRSDPRAVKLLLSLLDQYRDCAATSVGVDALPAEDRDILAQYLRERTDSPPASEGVFDGQLDDDGSS